MVFFKNMLFLVSKNRKLFFVFWLPNLFSYICCYRKHKIIFKNSCQTRPKALTFFLLLQNSSLTFSLVKHSKTKPRRKKLEKIKTQITKLDKCDKCDSSLHLPHFHVLYRNTNFSTSHYIVA